IALRDNVCTHAWSTNQLFSSAQCLGYHNENGRLTKDICQPSKDLIMRQTRAMVVSLDMKSIFVASDRNHMIDDFANSLQSLEYFDSTITLVPCNEFVRCISGRVVFS
uniref:GDP-fucose protein O-fucosyltransferase 1 n=1 Tax=Romanomermis culicivorax TaxID=13658 RepID=A0A915LCC7_ROMCU